MNRDSLSPGLYRPSLQVLCSVSKRRDVGYRAGFGPRTSGSQGERCRSRIIFYGSMYLLNRTDSAKGDLMATVL